MNPLSSDDERAAKALVNVLGTNRWHAVAYAQGYLAMTSGTSDETAIQIMRSQSDITLKLAREFLEKSKESGFLNSLQERDRKGSAENPITKLFPATVTEQRFLELLDDICIVRPSLRYTDDRHSRHALTDFTLYEAEDALPINIKNAGTRFEQAMQLVKLDPNDCLPIPAYKANAAIESVPNLLYNVSVDFQLVGTLNKLLSQILTSDETIVWNTLGNYKGPHVKSAEDDFIFHTVQKHWTAFKQVISHNPFHVISARKAVYILQSKPHRTPGIGLKAWGTGASAEVNVHVSILEDTTPWDVVSNRIKMNGIVDIIDAVNRKQVREIHVPEI